MRIITTEELKQKIDNKEDFTLVEVLGPNDFDDYHLPGAINVPADDKFPEEIQKVIPDKNRSVVLYCRNKECAASPRAAGQMEAVGYTDVSHYEAGKQAWKGQGLPTE